MEHVMIVICITQMIVNILLYALVLDNDQKMKRKMQLQRGELLDLIHQHQQWIEITQRGSTLQGLRNAAAKGDGATDDRTVAMRSLLLDIKKGENAE
jgi:hypothetical protein